MYKSFCIWFQGEIRQEIFDIVGDTDYHPTYKQLNELKLMERCIKKNLWLYPVVPLISRVADENFKNATGYVIRKERISTYQYLLWIDWKRYGKILMNLIHIDFYLRTLPEDILIHLYISVLDPKIILVSHFTPLSNKTTLFVKIC